MSVTPTNLDRYLDERWQDQLRYFSLIASRNKRRHQTALVIMGISGALIPVLITVDWPNSELDLTSVAAAVLGVVVAITSVLENTYQFGEQWRNARIANEALKRERWLFEMGVGDYADAEDRVMMFVERVELIIDRDVTLFSSQRQHQQSQAQRPSFKPMDTDAG